MVGVAQIGLIRTKGFLSWLIRFGTRSDYNHCVVAISHTSVVSAEQSGVQILPVSAFPDAKWSHFPLNGTQTSKILAFLIGDGTHGQLGKRYGVWTFIWYGAARALGIRTPDWIKRRLADRSSWICSQLCDAAYQAAGIHLFRDHRFQGEIVPGDFEPLWQDHHWL
jgi:hypothetical protein